MRKMRIGDTTPKFPTQPENVINVKKCAAQIPIVAVLSVAPAIVAGGEKENVAYLNHPNTPRKRLLAAKD